MMLRSQKLENDGFGGLRGSDATVDKFPNLNPATTTRSETISFYDRTHIEAAKKDLLRFSRLLETVP
jgi:hypothetical protein